MEIKMFNINQINSKNRLLSLIAILILITSCGSLGVNPPSNSFFGGSPVFYNGESRTIPIINLNNKRSPESSRSNYKYTLSEGDIISLVVWGLDEAFPMSGGGFVSSPIYSRLIDENGYVFVPYIGKVFVNGKTLSEARLSITEALGTEFVNPQVDINLQTPSNINQVFVTGEIRRPVEIPLGISPLSLTAALNRANGINLNTANASQIYVIRSAKNDPKIYKLDLSNANSYFVASNFELYKQDIVYVGTSSITKWNRYLTQIFPFASFINQIDQVDQRD